MGIGFTIGLTSIGIVRELIGSGTIFSQRILPQSYEGVAMFVLAPGAFLVLAFLCALQNRLGAKGANRHTKSDEPEGCDGNCMTCSLHTTEKEGENNG